MVDAVPGPERASAVLPLRAAGVLLGVMEISFDERQDFAAEDQEFLEALVDVCAIHLHQWSLLRSQNRRSTSAAALGRLVLALSAAEGPDQVSRVIAEEGAIAAAASFANIALLDADALT